MRTQTIILLILNIGLSCTNKNESEIKIPSQISNNAITGREIIRQSDGKIKEAVYFQIRNNDKLNLRYHFSQNSEGEIKIILYENDELKSPELSYREELQEQKLILREAAKDFELRSLKKIWDIYLMLTGDLAIMLTKQLPPEYAGRNLNNFNLGKFLFASKLTEDLNELLKPYGKKIKRYIVEKAGFIDNSFVIKENKIETPISEIPAKILTAQIWAVIENTND